MDLLDIDFLAREALIELENNLEKKPLRIVDATNSATKILDVSLLMEKEELEKNIDELKREIIVPACFYLVTKINKLGPSFNTFVRISPESDEKIWARAELSNISVTVVIEYNINHNCGTMKVAVCVAEDLNWRANEWIRSLYTPVESKKKALPIRTDSKLILIYGEWFEVSRGDYNHYIDLRIGD